MFWQFFCATGALLAAVMIAQACLVITFAEFQELGEGEDLRDRFTTKVILMTVILGFLGVGLSCWLTWRIVRPLQQLAIDAEQIAAGDYGRRVFVERDGELGILAKSFNHTSERLASQFAQLDEDRQQLRAVLSSMAEGVIAVDSAQNVLFANEQAAEVLGFDANVAVGRRLWETVRHRTIHDVVDKALHSNHGHLRELKYHGKADKNLTVFAGPLPGTSPHGAVIVVHDNTEIHRLERIRQDFVANVSHELKTPLSIIKANVETLMDGAVDDFEHRDGFLRGILDQADLLNALILDLLSLARIEAGTESFLLQEVPVEKVVSTCLDRRRTLVESKHQTLRVEPPEDTVSVWSDEESVVQIIDNLVDNAIKYTPEHGEIQVRWWAEEEWGIIEVKDTGIGIAKQELPRIFERFYRVDKARSRQLGGTGLGLSIVKHLVQSMQGSIQASSEVNRGSTFTVRLPLAVAKVME